MKKIILIMLFCITFIGLTGCNQKREQDNKDDACCEGCMCGDTIKLLKNTETAWNLTEIDSNGEYTYIEHSFINFHGTGKDRFAFYKDEQEIKGKFSINKKNEILLEPDNDNRKITCKIGEEKDLIAVIHCDNNFGTFTLQKEGTLELPNVIKETVSKTKWISITNRKQKITDEKDVQTFISIINNSKVWTGAVILPGSLYKIELLDEKDKILAEIEYHPNAYFYISINGKGYELTNIDEDLLNSLLPKLLLSNNN